VRGKAHALLAASDYDVGIARGDLLGSKSDGPETRAAHLVHAEGRLVDGNASGDGGLPRRVLTLTCGQHLAHDHFIDVSRVNVSALEGSLDGDLAKLVCRQGRQGAVEGANRRACRAHDDNLFVFHTDLQLRKGPRS